MANSENGNKNGNGHIYKAGPHRRPPSSAQGGSTAQAPGGSGATAPTSGAGPAAPAQPAAARPAAPANAPYKNSGKHSSGITLFGKTFDKKQFILITAACALAVLLAVCIAVAIVSPPFASASSSAASASRSSQQPSSSDTYDQTADQIDEVLLETTVLGKTADAGEEYVEETLFIGDSNTLRMSEYGYVTGVTLQNSIGIEGMGIQNAATNTCVRFAGYNSYVTIPQAVKLFQPRRIVVTFGTNNAGYNTPESFIDSYRTFLDTIHNAYPYADIIIGAVPPIAYGCNYGAVNMGAVDKYNAALAQMADELDYKFLNWSEALKDPSTGYAKSGYTVADGIHLNEAAMKAMFEYFRTHSRIVDDTRPKPLEPVPTQLAVPRPVSSSSPSGGTPSDSSSSSSSSSVTGQVSVPGVTGLSQGDVAAVLAGAGLGASFTQMYDPAAAGMAIAQSPAPGSVVPAGTVVVVTISLGPDPASISSSSVPVTPVDPSSSEPVPPVPDPSSSEPVPPVPDPSSSVAPTPDPGPSTEPTPTPSDSVPTESVPPAA